MYSGTRFIVFQPPWFRTLSVLRSARRRVALILFVIPFVIFALSIGASLQCAEQPTRANTKRFDYTPEIFLCSSALFLETNLLTILDEKIFEVLAGGWVLTDIGQLAPKDIT